MTSRNLFASIPIACVLAAGLLGLPPVADAESVVRAPKTGKVAGKTITKRDHRFRRLRSFHSVKVHLPIGPSYIYNDYPHYYARGYFPTHIGGYVYYPYQYYRGYCWGYNGGSPEICRQKARRN